MSRQPDPLHEATERTSRAPRGVGRGCILALLVASIGLGACAQTMERNASRATPSTLDASLPKAAKQPATDPSPMPTATPVHGTDAGTTSPPDAGKDAGKPVASVAMDAALPAECTSANADGGDAGQIGTARCQLPPSICADSRSLTYFENPSCDRGRCMWVAKSMLCPNGSCVNGACRPNTTK